LPASASDRSNRLSFPSTLPVKRLYQNILGEHLAANRQIAFLSGRRQIGRTTIARAAAGDAALTAPPAEPTATPARPAP
jgi:hypothetical protein